jgi:hypothetical protein
MQLRLGFRDGFPQRLPYNLVGQNWLAATICDIQTLIGESVSKWCVERPLSC